MLSSKNTRTKLKYTEPVQVLKNFNEMRVSNGGSLTDGPPYVDTQCNKYLVCKNIQSSFCLASGRIYFSICMIYAERKKKEKVTVQVETSRLTNQK